MEGIVYDGEELMGLCFLYSLGTRVKVCHLFVLLNEVKIVVRKLDAMTAISGYFVECTSTCVQH